MLSLRLYTLLFFIFIFTFNSTALQLELTLPVYKIEIDQHYLDVLNSNPTEDIYYPAKFDFDTISYTCDVRFRGATARELPKKSWKIQFKNNQNIFIAEELNLNAEYRDNSLMRNYLIMNLFKFLGYPASEVKFVNLFVNDEYKGVFVQIEQVDENFLYRNDIESGDLFKGVNHGANMSPIVNYQNYLTNWEPKIVSSDSYIKLQKFFSKIYYWTKEDFNENINDIINIDNIINYFAVIFSIASTDCFTKNIYLNHNLKTGKYELFPWDNDASLGNIWTGEYSPWLINTKKFSAFDNQVLFRRLLENTLWKNEFSIKVNRIISDGFSYLRSVIDSTYEIIKNDYYLDPEKGCSNDDFESDITNLHTFLEGRENALSGYSANDVNSLYDVEIFDGLISPDDTIISINVKSELPQSVYFKYVLDFDPHIWGDQYDLMSLELYDDGNHNDKAAGDLIYGNSLDPSDLPDEIMPVFFRSEDNLDYPYNGVFLINQTINRTISLTLNNLNNTDIREFLEIKEIFTYQNKYCIQIKNNSFEYADISFCYIQSGEYFNIFSFPGETIIPPMGSIIISSDNSFSENYFPQFNSIGNCFFELATNDTIRLLSPTLNEISSQFIYPTIIEYVPKRIVINEINYNSSVIFNTEDWAELYNPNDYGVDLSGWIFKDSQHDNTFIIPQNIFIPAKEYIIVCNDSDRFSSKLPFIDNIIGDFDFNLSGSGDMVLLYDNCGVLIDSVNYDDKDPWPERADGLGATLELKSPDLDNSLAESWVASDDYGSPGEINPYYNNTNDEMLHDVRFDIYPNPFISSTSISFSVNKPDQIDLTIYSSQGKFIEKLISKTLLQGQHTVNWRPKSIDSGIYYAILKIGNSQVYNNRIVYVK
ncbi:CotH kinase family protein [Bacteroidota bacterium]